VHVVILRKQCIVEAARSRQEFRGSLALSTNVYLAVRDTSSPRIIYFFYLVIRAMSPTSIDVTRPDNMREGAAEFGETICSDSTKWKPLQSSKIDGW
jgi:hypothetical protein